MPAMPPDDARATRGETTNLPVAAERLLATATTSNARRAGQTLVPGAHAPLKQTLLALGSGTTLNEHESPTAATLQVLLGRIRLVTDDDVVALDAGDFAPIPRVRHSVDAVDDAVLLLTAVQ